MSDQPIEPPHDDRAERQLISLVCMFPEFYKQAAHLRPEHFRLIDAAAAWYKLSDTLKNGGQPDPADYLAFHDMTYPVAPLRTVAEELVGRVGQSAYARAVLIHLSQIAQAAWHKDENEILHLYANAPRPEIGASGVDDVADIASVLYDELTGGFQSSSIGIGIEALDRALGGAFELQTLTILPARPGMGKTAAMVQAADTLSAQGFVTVVFSKEMSKKQWVRRMACRRAKVPLPLYKSNKLDTEQREAVEAEYLEIMSRRPTLFIDETARQTTDQVFAICDRLKTKYGRIDAILADHCRLFSDSDKNDNEVHRQGAVSWGFKQIAKELNTRSLLAVQLNRDVEKRAKEKDGTHPKPDLADIRDSGEIEENADNAVFVHRERYYDPSADRSAEFISRKARDGERNNASIAVFQEEYMSFEPAAVRSGRL